MKISTAPPLHLSNHEVLSHFIALKRDTDALKQQRANHDLRDKVDMREAYPLAKERDDPPDGSTLPRLTDAVRRQEDEADRRGWSDELAWIQDEVIRYLCSDHVPTARQTADGVAQLADTLQDHSLTKGEVLQIVNLAPTLPVELYAIIEDVDSRFEPGAHDRLEQIAEQVAGTLLSQPPHELEPHVTRMQHEPSSRKGHEAEMFEEEDGEEEEGFMEQEFVTEATYGAAYEGGVDDEVREDMD